MSRPLPNIQHATRCCVLGCFLGWASATGACGANEGSLGQPDIAIGPSRPIELEFVNSTEDDIYIALLQAELAYELSQGTTQLYTQRDCIPLCGEGCFCSSCTSTTPMARRVPAGETLSVSWLPIHYMQSTCSHADAPTPSACKCVESWPLTAGTYQLSLHGFTNAEGGLESPTSPNLVQGATRGNNSVDCRATTEFELAAESIQARAHFVCPK